MVNCLLQLYELPFYKYHIINIDANFFPDVFFAFFLVFLSIHTFILKDVLSPVWPYLHYDRLRVFIF